MSDYGHIVLASTKREFFPSIIRAVTRSRFSHSLLTIPDVLGLPMCIEAASNGVDAMRFDKGYVNNPNQEFEVWEVLVPQSVKDEAIKGCLDLLESSYGYLELPWFAWRALNELVGKDIKRQDNWSQNGTICSELCRVYLEGCGFKDLFAGFGKGSFNAEDLSVIMRANPATFRLLYSSFLSSRVA